MGITDSIKKVVLKLFPELSAGYHLPLFAQVVGVRETPNEGDVSEAFRPRYAVDVQILTEQGKVNPAFPTFYDVMLSLPVAGHEMGQFAYPEIGSWVELAFAYGSPNRPFIRSVLPHNLTLPSVEQGEQRWQHNPESFMRMDKDGNHDRITDLTITDISLNRVIEAMKVVETFHQQHKYVDSNDTEVIGAIKRIQAFGAVVVESGGVLDLSAVNHIRLTTKANAIIKALGDMTTDIDGDASATIGGKSTLSATNGVESSTPASQSFKAAATWIGSPTENMVNLMSETTQLVIDLANILASHTHPSTGQITQSSNVSNISTQAAAIKARIDGVGS